MHAEASGSATRVLLHICCGPCAIMPIRVLLERGFAVTGWFYNPNIHPLEEYLRRREGAVAVARAHGIPLVFSDDMPEYGVEPWCRSAFAHEGGRCAFCRESRFEAVARKAVASGLTVFTSSLLYSRHQNHQGMIKAGERAAAIYGGSFLYHDFRAFWNQGIQASKELGIYRQQYCGCVFSEEERYSKILEKTIGVEG